MKINLGGFSGKFYAFEFKAESASIEVDFYEVLAAFLNSKLPVSVRKKAEETLETYADNACPLDPDYNTWLAVDKTQAYSELYPESSDDSKADSTLVVEGQIKPGKESLDDSGSQTKFSDLWEQYKASVLCPTLEKTLAQCTTKAALKAADNRIKDLRKCLSISLSPKFDEDFLEQMYLAKSKIYGELPDNSLPIIESGIEAESEADSSTGPGLQSETKCNAPGVENKSQEPGIDSGNPVPIYVLRENQHLIPEGAESGSYTIVDNCLDIPHKTCQYLDENGEVGEAVYAMAQARKDILAGKVVFKKATEDENKAALEARLKAIEDNPDYSPEEKANRSWNARVRYGITDFSKV